MLQKLRKLFDLCLLRYVGLLIACFVHYAVAVLQDVASDSGIGDMVFGGNDGTSHLPTEVEKDENSPPGTAEGMSLPGAVEGMSLPGTVEGVPLNDTAEGIPPSSTAVDGKQLKLTVLGVCTIIFRYSMSFLPALHGPTG